MRFFGSDYPCIYPSVFRSSKVRFFSSFCYFKVRIFSRMSRCIHPCIFFLPFRVKQVRIFSGPSEREKQLLLGQNTVRLPRKTVSALLKASFPARDSTKAPFLLPLGRPKTQPKTLHAEKTARFVLVEGRQTLQQPQTAPYHVPKSFQPRGEILTSLFC